MRSRRVGRLFELLAQTLCYRGCVRLLLYSVLSAVLLPWSATTASAAEGDDPLDQAPPWIDLAINIKRGHFTAREGESINGWLVVSNLGSARVPGAVEDGGYVVEMAILEDIGVLKPVPAVTDYSEHALAPLVRLDDTPALATAEETVLEFTVPLTGNVPEHANLCGIITWNSTFLKRLERNKRNNFSCSRLIVPAATRHEEEGSAGAIQGDQTVSDPEAALRPDSCDRGCE